MDFATLLDLVGGVCVRIIWRVLLQGVFPRISWVCLWVVNLEDLWRTLLRCIFWIIWWVKLLLIMCLWKVFIDDVFEFFGCSSLLVPLSIRRLVLLFGYCVFFYCSSLYRGNRIVKFLQSGSVTTSEAKKKKNSQDCGSALHTYIHNLLPKIFYYSNCNFLQEKIANSLI